MIPPSLMSYLVQLEMSGHGLIPVKAGIHQFLDLRKLMGTGDLIRHFRSLLTHCGKLIHIHLTTQTILDMTGRDADVRAILYY